MKITLDKIITSFFGRLDSAITVQTIQIYISEIKKSKETVWKFLSTILFADLLYLVLMPLLISFILQSLIVNPHDIETPIWLVVGLIATSIVTVLINHPAHMAMFAHSEKMATKFSELAMNKLMAHSQGFFSNQKVGALAGEVYGFARSYSTLLDTFFFQLSGVVVSFVASLVIIAFISPLLLIPLGILTFLVVYQSIRSIAARQVYRKEYKQRNARFVGTVADIIGNQTLVRMFARNQHEFNTVHNERMKIEAINEKNYTVVQRWATIRQLTLYTFQILTVIACIYLFSVESISIAALIFSVTYLGRITSSLYAISGVIRTVEQSLLDAATLTQIINDTPAVLDSKNATALIVKKSDIEIKDLVYGYANTDQGSVFSGLSLKIPHGQAVGLVGRSGGGKTTLTHLLLRYMDVESGSIQIDQQNISEITQDSLRENISYVPQDPYLFHRTLKDNIIYGKPNASESQIISAAKNAYAWEFIKDLPNGLDTVVGERGVKLSGGQRQRIAIARAILKDAPILLLDEATSALDSESELYIQKALQKLMKHRTSIVIAHRLSTIAKLDRILMLEGGAIIEDGAHKDLLAKNGQYAKLWKHQSGGFIEE